MTEPFEYDVFLSYSSKDRPVVRELAERLRGDGLHVWFDEWEIQPGDLISLKIEQGLEKSQTLVLALSASALASDWVRLEHHTVLFRDPTNARRRFIPLRLDKSETGHVLQQFAYVDWQDRSEDQYARLLTACRSGFETKPLPPLSESKHLWRTPMLIALTLILVFGIGVLIPFFKEREKAVAVSTEPAPLAGGADGGGPPPLPPNSRSVQAKPDSRILATQPATDPPPPKPARKKTIESPSSIVEPYPPPEEISKVQTSSEPAPTAPSPPEPASVVEERPVSPADSGLDQFKALEGLVISIESLSKKAVEDCEAEGKEDEICNRLEDFSEAAMALRREFRKATGTGTRIPRIFSKLRGEASTKALEIKVDDLTRKREAIDGLMASNPPGQHTQSQWREIQDNLRKLKGYF